jgi:hypothetical protein
VQVHCDEGVAIHIDPESCAGGREAAREALTGARAGQPSSRENAIPGADAVRTAEGSTRGRVMRVPPRPGEVADPGMHGRSLHGNREISCPARGGPPLLARIGKARSRSR